MDWFTSNGARDIAILILAVIIAHYLIKFFLAKLVKRAVRLSRHAGSPAAQKKRVDTLVHIIGAALSVLMWVILIIGTLTILKINITGVIAGVGAIGLILGLGGQTLIKDFLAGFFILVENQYRVGDVVTIGSVSGIVESINLRITRLRDLDGNVHVIPNGSIELVTNRTFGFSSVNINIGVSYSSDIDKVKQVIDEVGKEMAKSKDWKELILEPIAFLRVNEFGDSAIQIKCLGKVSPGKQWEAAGEFRARLKKAFDKNGIEIPFPQHVIHQAKK